MAYNNGRPVGKITPNRPLPQAQKAEEPEEPARASRIAVIAFAVSFAALLIAFVALCVMGPGAQADYSAMSAAEAAKASATANMPRIAVGGLLAIEAAGAAVYLLLTRTGKKAQAAKELARGACPECGATNVKKVGHARECRECGHAWRD